MLELLVQILHKVLVLGGHLAVPLRQLGEREEKSEIHTLNL